MGAIAGSGSSRVRERAARRGAGGQPSEGRGRELERRASSRGRGVDLVSAERDAGDSGPLGCCQGKPAAAGGAGPLAGGAGPLAGDEASAGLLAGGAGISGGCRGRTADGARGMESVGTARVG